MAPDHGHGGRSCLDEHTPFLDNAPITKERPPPFDIHQRIEHPACPRANAAPSTENPKPQTTNGQTVLQAHCSFWDPDNDGIIWPGDTLRGLHAIGFWWVLAALGALIIHGAFSWFTSPSWIPDPRLPIYLKNIHRCKHGGDTETYDTEGRYVPAHFEEIFSKWAKKDDKLSRADIIAMIRAKRNINDPNGWVSSALEWGALWFVARDEQGLLSKERVRANYDGSLWPLLARETKERRARQRKQASGLAHGLAAKAQHKIRAAD